MIMELCDPGSTGGLPSITPGPMQNHARWEDLDVKILCNFVSGTIIKPFYRVMFRLFPGSGAPLETLNFDGEL